jgi:hypothetical protein
MDRTSGTPAAGAQSGGGSASTPGFALTVSLKYVRQEERKKAEFDFQVSQAVNRNAAPQGSLRLLLGDLNVDNYIREVNLDDPFFRELGARIGVTGDWNMLGIEKVVVNATYQPDPAGPIVHRDGWTFNQTNEDSKPFNVLLDKNRPVRLYKYKTQIFLKDLDYIDSKTRVLEKEDTTEEREKLINPANEFQPLLVRVEAGALDWNTAARVDVKLRYEDSNNAFAADQMFSFTQDQHASRQWVLYPVDPNKRTYKVIFGYTIKDSAGNMTYFEYGHDDWSAEGVVVPSPFRGTRAVRITPAVDREEVQEVSAEVLFEKDGYRYHEDLLFEEGKLGTRTVNIPVPDPDPEHDRYKVRWSILYKNFQTYEVSWTDFQGDRVMLDDGVHTVGSLRIEFYRSPEQAGLVGILLKVESLAPDGTVVDADKLMVRGSQTFCAFELMFQKGTPLRYRYTMTKITATTQEVLGPVESSDPEPYLEV